MFTSNNSSNLSASEKEAKLSGDQKGQIQKAQENTYKELIEAERIYREGVISIRDIIAPASFKVESDYVQLGSTYVRTIFCIGYPRYISVGWFFSIINYPALLDISMFVYPIKTEIILKQLKNRVGAIQAQLGADREKGMPRDPLRETALTDIENLRDMLTQGSEKFFQFGLYVSLYAESKDKLDKMTEEVESTFGSRLILSRRTVFQAEQGFNSTLPLCNDELALSYNMNSSPIATSFPFISSDLTSDRGILYGVNLHNNSLIIFDRFSLQNANAVVFATSGAGKSYTVKLEIFRHLMMGTEVIVIDPENEYKQLADAVGGAYVDISLNSETKINPFDLPRGIGGNAKAGDIIRSSVITLKGLMRLMLGELSHQEDSIIDRALLETYAKKDITADSDLAHVTPPTMADFEEVLSGMEGVGDLVLRLQKYTKGTFSGMFDSYTNVDTKNQLIIFSTRDLEDELRPIGIYNIVNYIWNVVRSELKKRLLIIDEAWWLMQSEDSAKFVFALVKRCRKYYLGVTTITQDVADFLRNQYGQAIVTNSQMKILLKQSSASVDNLKKTFLLTDSEKFFLLECNVGEGIIFAGPKHVAMRVVASVTEDSIVTTDPNQLLRLEQAKKEFAEQMAASAK